MDRPRALVFDIKRDCSEDGPGIRTTVFFKGCPLSCSWCQNPEGLLRQPERDADGNSVGYWIDLQELLYRVTVDRPFFDSSGGGITLSGGEPTMQMDFIHHFLRRLKGMGIHTAIETCGFFNYRRFRRLVLPYLDLVYFDLKLFDADASRRHTGRSSLPIRENVTRMAEETSVTVMPRVPLVPDVTATRENLAAWARFLRNKDIRECTLIPYNPLWRDKLERLNRIPRYGRSTFMTQREEERCIQYMVEPANQ